MMREDTLIHEAPASNPPTRVGVYILSVLLAAVGGYFYMLRNQSILTCPGTGYGPDSYLAYCAGEQYGDFDHGAFWLDLEPGIRKLAASADVLFLGNSRMQFAFSSDSVGRWFSAAGVSHYLMGFAYWENYTFEWPLVKQIRPNPKVLIVNLDGFFRSTETPPATTVMHENDAAGRYERKRLWQIAHRQICSRIPGICGSKESFYRSIATGTYTRVGGGTRTTPVTYDANVDEKMLADYTRRGNEFFSSLPTNRRCVLLTMVPANPLPGSDKTTSSGTAKAIANALGLSLIAPELPALTTFDGSHLDRPSAERWSQAFLEEASPRIRDCLDSNTAGAR
jgi:hypothetical protein